MDKLVSQKTSEDEEMVIRKSWDEFRQTGLLWFANTILHAFGWAIVYEYKDGKLSYIYPARTKFRGFGEETATKNYRKLTEYMRDNANSLMEDIGEETEG